MNELEPLPGLGPVSAQWLVQIGIRSHRDLVNMGALAAYLKLKRSGVNTGLNMLYALVGAVERRHWTDVAKTEKTRLLNELKAVQEFDALTHCDDQ